MGPGRAVCGGVGSSEVGFVLLELHHQMVDVDEVGAGGEGAEGGQGQNLLEAVVVLDELRQGTLQ